MSPQPYRQVQAAFLKSDASHGLAGRAGISVIRLDLGGILAVACLSHLGYRMVGVDLDAERVKDLEGGWQATTDPRLETLLWEGASSGQIRATQNLIAAVLDTDMTLISMGARATGTDGMRRTAAAIGQALAMKAGFHVVVLRAPVAPGATLGTLAPAIERTSGKRAGFDFGLCLMPEFGRHPTTVMHFFSPSRTVIGCSDARTSALVASVFEQIDDKLRRTSIETAEMVVHAERKWQATRQAFSDEIAQLSDLLEQFPLDLGRDP